MPPAIETPDVVRRPGGRSARIRAAVYSAAIDELLGHGYAGLNAARIGERAGVHRTTIHRHWPDLDHLLAEALIDQANEAIPIPDTGNVRDDLRELLRAIAPFIDNPRARQPIRSLIAGAARSTGAANLAREVWTTRFQVGAEVLARAIDRGEIRSDISPVTLMEYFVGPLYVRLLITEEPVDDAFVESVIEIGLNGSALGPAGSTPTY
jgi:AcrR family transcriptional regulator